MVSRVQLCDPMDCSPPGSFVPGVFPARILEWVAISSSGDLSDPEIELFLWLLLLQLLHGRWILYHCATWEALAFWGGGGGIKNYSCFINKISESQKIRALQVHRVY